MEYAADVILTLLPSTNYNVGSAEPAGGDSGCDAGQRSGCRVHLHHLECAGEQIARLSVSLQRTSSTPRFGGLESLAHRFVE